MRNILVLENPRISGKALHKSLESFSIVCDFQPFFFLFLNNRSANVEVKLNKFTVNDDRRFYLHLSYSELQLLQKRNILFNIKCFFAIHGQFFTYNEFSASCGKIS